MDTNETMNLPGWSECRDATENGEASALQKYIYHNEPAGIVDGAEWRKALSELIDELVKNTLSEDTALLNTGAIRLCVYDGISGPVLCTFTQIDLRKAIKVAQE